MGLLDRDPFARDVPGVVVDEKPDEWEQILKAIEVAATPPVSPPAPVIPAPRVNVAAPDLGPLLEAVQASRVDVAVLAEVVGAAVAVALSRQPDTTAALEAVVVELEALRKKFRSAAGGGGGGGGSTDVYLRAGVDGMRLSDDNPLPVMVMDADAVVTPVVATVTASGDTTIHTPAEGKAIRLHWISAINDPDEATTPLVKVKLANPALGQDEIYRVYALGHRQVFEGAPDEPLVVNLSAAAMVAVTAHIEEF